MICGPLHHCTTERYVTFYLLSSVLKADTFTNTPRSIKLHCTFVSRPQGGNFTITPRSITSHTTVCFPFSRRTNTPRSVNNILPCVSRYQGDLLHQYTTEPKVAFYMRSAVLKADHYTTRILSVKSHSTCGLPFSRQITKPLHHAALIIFCISSPVLKADHYTNIPRIER